MAVGQINYLSVSFVFNYILTGFLFNFSKEKRKKNAGYHWNVRVLCHKSSQYNTLTFVSLFHYNKPNLFNLMAITAIYEWDRKKLPISMLNVETFHCCLFWIIVVEEISDFLKYIFMIRTHKK